jgi:cell wall-associated NlpC family hydrolase
VGYSVPRTSAQQYRAASPVPVGQAQAGDLLFFRYEDKVSHVAIYLGDEQFVHAPSSGKRVSVASLRNAHYQQHFVSVGRLPVRQ